MYVTSYTIVTVSDTTADDDARLIVLADACGAADWRAWRKDDVDPMEKSQFTAYFFNTEKMAEFIETAEAMRS